MAPMVIISSILIVHCDFTDDLATTPGRCIRAKNLTPCSTSADCIEVDESCSALNDIQGQSYCLPTPKDSANDLQQLLEDNAPGKHKAFSKQLSEYGKLCKTSIMYDVGIFTKAASNAQSISRSLLRPMIQ